MNGVKSIVALSGLMALTACGGGDGGGVAAVIDLPRQEASSPPPSLPPTSPSPPPAQDPAPVPEPLPVVPDPLPAPAPAPAPPPSASSPPPQQTTSGPAQTNAFRRSYVTSYDSAAVARVRTGAEFRAQERRGTFALQDGRVVPPGSPFLSSRLDYARSTGLDGSGVTVAIVDDGYRPTHRELAGKDIAVSSNPVPLDHGTAVAAILAGREDGVGMMGVAPRAKLHLSAFRNAGGGTDLAALARGTREATSLGAVVQNNSWGFDVPISRMREHMAANPQASVADAFTASIGGSRAQGKAYVDALTEFAGRGVVVFAVSNDTDDVSTQIMAGLPVVAPELAAGWLAVVNAVPQTTEERVVSATRLSARCLEMAAHCLTAEGVVLSASADADGSYRRWLGSSFAAPQVSGGLALLAQAFPDLTAAELRNRLLASADNGFYAHTGQVDYGNGVVHGYNEEFGHGFLDLRAALLPIGPVGLPQPNGEARADEATIPLGSSFALAGPAQGDALTRALDGVEVAVFDALGADFRAPALSLVGVERKDRGRALRVYAAGGPAGTQEVASFGWSQPAADGRGETRFSFASGSTAPVLESLGLAPTPAGAFADPTRLFGLAEDSVSAGFSMAMPDAGTWAFYAFGTPQTESGPLAEEEYTGAFGGGFSYAADLGPAGGRLGLSALGETGAALGLKGRGGYFGEIEGSSLAFDMQTTLPLAFGLSLTAGGQVGTSTASATGALSMEPGVFTGFDLALSSADLMREGDSLSFVVAQPVRLERGEATLRLPVGRDRAGNIRWQDLSFDLAPEARQIDLGLAYAMAIGEDAGLRLGATLSLNEGHRAGERATAVAAAFVQRF